MNLFKSNTKIELAAHALRAKDATGVLALLTSKDKNKALMAMAAAVTGNKKFILRENAKDIVEARKKALPPALISRLVLDEEKLRGITASLASIAKLPDPVGRILSTHKRPNGLVIKKVRVPIGVILIIYESRPNVTADCMALCLKSGNSVILKGGSEALRSNTALHRILSRAAQKEGIPQGASELITTSDRKELRQLLSRNDLIDLVIPRGGEGLIREVAEVSKIPVIKHFKGVCHVFVDKDANLKKSEEIVLNAKVQSPGVCNAMETLLVHTAIAKKFLPKMAERLRRAGVEIRGCERTRMLIPQARKATEEDWFAEYLDLILAVRIVKDAKAAAHHIQTYGSHHTDAIVTENKKTAAQFTKTVDSACVFVNCSTRFNDGGEFGMGAEMGISTDKLHARGPMGLEELTSYKYVVLGNGQIRK